MVLTHDTFIYKKIYNICFFKQYVYEKIESQVFLLLCISDVCKGTGIFFLKMSSGGNSHTVQ